MKTLATSPANAAPTNALVPGVSYFQVLELAPLLGPNGEAQYAMAGPFLDLAQASQFCQARPGSLITVTLVLFQAPRISPLKEAH